MLATEFLSAATKRPFQVIRGVLWTEGQQLWA